MSERCSAMNDDGKRCLRKKDLALIRVATDAQSYRSLILPSRVVIGLCPKHFVMQKAGAQ